MIRKIIESHKMLFVCIILYMAMLFAAKLGYEAATHESIVKPIYTGRRLN